MPLYEYGCRGCGKRFEVLQRIGANASEVACPGCGAVDVEKKFSTFASAMSPASGGSLPCGAPAAGGCGGGGGFS